MKNIIIIAVAGVIIYYLFFVKKVHQSFTQKEEGGLGSYDFEVSQDSITLINEDADYWQNWMS